MAQSVQQETDLYRIEEDAEIGATIFTWKKFASGDTFREGANELLDYVRSNRVSKLIVDASGIQAHNDEDQRWLQQEWTPAIIDAGVDHTATVHQDSVISKMDVEQMMEGMEHLDQEAFVTDDLDEAREWIASQ